MTNAAAGRVAAIIPAAGSGVRLGTQIPKAFVELANMSLLKRSAIALGQLVDVIVVAAPQGYLENAADEIATVEVEKIVVVGGDDRQSSVAAALQAIPSDVDIVLVHDAARPLVPFRVIEDVVLAIRAGAKGVVPVLPIADTIKRLDSAGRVIETIDRDSLRRVQTPQGFARQVLDQVHSDPTHSATDDAGLLEAAGFEVSTVLGDERALKITTMDDIQHALSFLEETL
jgi:2-C-methyl-D-erythritol 4-phosphate cytidylyltransferase